MLETVIKYIQFGTHSWNMISTISVSIYEGVSINYINVRDFYKWRRWLLLLLLSVKTNSVKSAQLIGLRFKSNDSAWTDLELSKEREILTVSKLCKMTHMSASVSWHPTHTHIHSIMYLQWGWNPFLSNGRSVCNMYVNTWSQSIYQLFSTETLTLHTHARVY